MSVVNRPCKRLHVALHKALMKLYRSSTQSSTKALQKLYKSFAQTSIQGSTKALPMR